MMVLVNTGHTIPLGSAVKSSGVTAHKFSHPLLMPPNVVLQ
jgi:hypothetical protein